MSLNGKGLLDDEHARTFLQNIINARRAGIFSWQMDEDRFEVMEKFTGRTFKNIQTLEEFIRQIVFKKDIEMALQDVELFMTGVEPSYQSTFRVLDSSGRMRWLFVKGSVMADNRMSAIMYDVTEGNLKQGHDLRTNLMNNETLMRKLRNSIENTKLRNEHGALLYIDISNFHTLINRHGIGFGDSILYKFSRILLDFAGEYNEVARFPYDKFMILLNKITSIAEVEQMAEAISMLFEEPLHIDGERIYLSVNLGITTFPDMSSDVNELMRFSEFTINHARKSGGRGITLFNEELMGDYNRVLDIENELPTAIYNQELSLVYQPQLALKTNEIIGFEALVRWKNRNIGFVSPDEFIPIAEDKGYIVPIGRWIREESLKTARRWLDLGMEFSKFSINISTVEITRKDFKPHLLCLCEQYRIEPKMIELEITERTFVETEEEQNNIINELLAEGFKIALDDFGTGYSNLRSLVVHQIDTLKLDKSLIDNIYEQQHIIKGLLEAKNHLYHEIVAEGVEDKETMALLRELEFDTVQGYYFSRPLTRSDMERFVIEFKQSKMNK